MRVYGASDPALAVTYTGFVNGETSGVLGGTLSIVDTNAATTTAVGTYTGVITASGQTATNYTITYVAGNLTVTPAALTITADGVSRVYGHRTRRLVSATWASSMVRRRVCWEAHCR